MEEGSIIKIKEYFWYFYIKKVEMIDIKKMYT